MLCAGEPSALYTEDVPAADAPIFAATAMHSLLLLSSTPPSVDILLGTSQGQEPILLFEVGLIHDL